MTHSFNYDLAACVLLEAVFTTDDLACAKYGITPRTLRRYRKRQAEDPHLVAVFLQKKAALDAAWAASMPSALIQGLRTLEKCFTEIYADPRACKNPVILHALAGAFRMIAEVQLTSKVIDARFTNADRPQGQVLGQGAAESVSEYPN